MARNRLRHETVPAGPVVKVLALAGTLALVGLAYVNCVNRVHHLGERRSQLERDLNQESAKLEEVRQEVVRRSSRAELQRLLNEGFILLVPIQDDRIVRLRLPAAGAGGVRAVSNMEAVR